MANPNQRSLIDKATKLKVSSFLDKSVGKKYLTDGSPETCWTSQQGLPQYVHVTFEQAVVPKTILLTFQGGFVGTRCNVSVAYPAGEEETGTAVSDLKHLTYIYPEDVNRKQTFELPETLPVKEMKLTFEESSDFFGRITIYDLQITGLLPEASGDSDSNDQE